MGAARQAGTLHDVGSDLSRRSVLLGIGALATAAGCSRWVPADVTADRLAAAQLRKTLAVEVALIAAYRASGATPAILANHEEHAEVLRQRLRLAADFSPKPGGLPADPAAAEREATGLASAASNAAADDETAALLGSIAASEASHAALLGAPPELSGGAWRAVDGKQLNAVLAAEHAAIFGYGAMGAWLRGDALAVCGELQQAHRERRDALSAAVVRSGAKPVAAAPNYQLPEQVTSAAAAIALGVTLEENCAAVWRALVPQRTHDRPTAIAGLAGCAIAAARWRTFAGQPPTVAFPGS